MMVVEPEEMSSSSWTMLQEMLGDLELTHYDRHDTLVHSTLLFRTDRTLERREGFTSGDYAGSPYRYSLRYKMQYQQWAAGFSAEKGSGEDWRRRIPFSDSYSLYAQYQGSKRLRRLILGSYRLRLGQGLILNQQFNLGKLPMTALTSAATHASSRLSPHGSTSAANHMVGAAAEIRLGKTFTLLPFFSTHPIDGTLSNGILTSWSTDGMHRTSQEIGKRHQSWITDLGLHTSYQNAWLDLGANVVYSHLKHDFIRPIRKYNAHVFRGHQLFSASVDYRLHLLGCWLSGEAAIDDGGAMASTNILRRPISESWQMALLWRYLDDRYRQLHGSTLAESSQMQGERGVSLMSQVQLGRRWQLQTVVDYWHFTTPQYGIYAPSRGMEGLIRLQYTRRRFNAHCSYRIKWKAANDTSTDKIDDDLTQTLRHSTDARLDWKASQHLSFLTMLHNRIFSSANTGGYNYGWAAGQGMEFDFPSCYLRGSIQGTWFDAKEYDMRIYQSEPSLLYAWEMPMLYGRGERMSVMLQFLPPKFRHYKMALEMKYSWLHYADHRNTISSGPQTIHGNHEQHLWIQLRLSL